MTDTLAQVRASPRPRLGIPTAAKALAPDRSPAL